jgi:CBS domain containing-hemolysin-like protein
MLVLVVLSLVFLASILLHQAARVLPLKELRRRARAGKNNRARSIYKMAAYGPVLEIILWLIGGLSAAGLILSINKASAWVIALVILLLSWLALSEWFKSPPEGWLWSLAGFLAPAASGLSSLLQPILKMPAKWLSKRRPESSHSQLYEKEDLIELLRIQNQQLDSRLSETELKVARGALTFGAKSVGSVMTPRAEVKMVLATEPIGPLLMDELFASGFSRFPVVKEITRSATPEILGTLYLKDVVGHEGKGRIKDVMKKPAHFINEDQSLRQALAAFLKTEALLFVVVNNFEEVSGVLTVDDIIEQILGAKLDGEFDGYDNPIRVAKEQSENG